MTGPPTWPPSGWPPQPPQQPTPTDQSPTRPVDVDTGFWLWLAALPMTTTGYLLSALTAPEVSGSSAIYPIVGLIAVLLCALVLTLLILMRAGYRWARTVLTGGGVATVVYSLSGLMHADHRPAVAVGYAFTSIVGSVLIAGGTFLLHRNDAQGYFIR